MRPEHKSCLQRQGYDARLREHTREFNPPGKLCTLGKCLREKKVVSMIKVTGLKGWESGDFILVL